MQEGLWDFISDFKEQGKEKLGLERCKGKRKPTLRALNCRWAGSFSHRSADTLLTHASHTSYETDTQAEPRKQQMGTQQ